MLRGMQLDALNPGQPPSPSLIDRSLPTIEHSQQSSESAIAANPSVAHPAALANLVGPVSAPESLTRGVVDVIAHDGGGRAC